MLSSATKALEPLLVRFQTADVEGLRHGLRVAVWMRWLLLAVCLIGANYRVELGTSLHLLSNGFIIASILGNGLLHLRILANRPTAPPQLMVHSALDLTLISIVVACSGRFESDYFILCCLVLAMFAVLFASSWLNFVAATVVAAVYAALIVYVGPGVDLGSPDERALVIRVLSLYGVVALVHLVVAVERAKRIGQFRREKDSELHQLRVELSQVIHDTTAQSVFMIGLGLETAMELADKSNRKLSDSLAATYSLSRSALWELRHPIDIGLVFEGRDLVDVLQSHAGTFSSITSISADVLVNGKEPALSASTRSSLFSIAHNAMTNAYRHASPTRVTIALGFEPDLIRLSVSDDGIGLPRNYAERGHGFRNMRINAESLGGRLEVKTGNHGAGTAITCLIPYETSPGG